MKTKMKTKTKMKMKIKNVNFWDVTRGGFVTRGRLGQLNHPSLL